MKPDQRVQRTHLRITPRRPEQPYAEFGASLVLLSLLLGGAVLALLLQANWPKALRVGLASAAYLGMLAVWGVSGAGAERAPSAWPAWPFIMSGCVAGLINGMVRPQVTLLVTAVQVAGAGLLVGGFHWLAVRLWSRVHRWVAA